MTLYFNFSYVYVCLPECMSVHGVSAWWPESPKNASDPLNGDDGQL